MSLLSGNRNGLIGVDIGTSSIKVAELHRGHSGYHLHAAAVVPLPPGAIVENTVEKADVVAQVLREAVRQAGVSTDRAAIAVAGNAVIVKTILLPAMSELELESQIAYEADQYVPYDMDELYLDFHVLGPAEQDPEQMEVVLVVCKRNIIEDYQLLFNEAGLTLVCVDCAVFALQNIAELLHEIPSAKPANGIHLLQPKKNFSPTIALINIGAAMIHVNILVEGRMTFVRDHFFGGNELTEAIQRIHQLSFQDAERMKIEDFSVVQKDAVDQYLAKLASELMYALDFYSANHSDRPVDKIFLSGGGALVPGIAEALEIRLGIDAEVLQPFPSITIAHNKAFNPDMMQKLGPRMVLPLGLAIRAFLP